MDPMCGSGQTTKVAKSLGRSFVGVDLRRQYASLAKKRLKESPMLSNFIIPLYFPIKWFNSVQSGRKQDAHLDVEEQIPRGYKMVLQKTSRDEENGTDTTHIYYKNKSGDYLFCVIGSGQEPYMMKVGDPKKKGSVAGIIAKKLPKEFGLNDLGNAMPREVAGERYSVLSIADVLEHAKISEKKSGKRKNISYMKR